MPSDAQSLSELFGGFFGGSSYGGTNYGGGYDIDEDDDEDEDEDEDEEDFDVDDYINSLLDGDEAESLQDSLDEAEKALEALDDIDWDQLEELLNALQ